MNKQDLDGPVGLEVILIENELTKNAYPDFLFNEVIGKVGDYQVAHTRFPRFMCVFTSKFGPVPMQDFQMMVIPCDKYQVIVKTNVGISIGGIHFIDTEGVRWEDIFEAKKRMIISFMERYKPDIL